MHKYFKQSIIACVAGLSVFLTACNDNKDQIQFTYQNYQSETNYQLDQLEKASSIKIMTYLMPNVLGKTAKATALVIFPKTARPKDGWRIVVWSHGTTGVGDSCAPSNNILNERFEILANSLLDAGYVVVAPDYEGLGTSGIHPYLNLSSEANSAIYAVKAVQEKYVDTLNKAWMSIGQSQGGHSSLGIAEYSNTNPDFKGSVATAPASSLGYIITQVAPAAIQQLEQAELAGLYPTGTAIDVYSELLAYAAYTGVGIKAYQPQFNLGTIFKDESKLIAEKAEGTTGENGLCLTELMDEFSTALATYKKQYPDHSVLDFPGLQTGFENDATVKKFLADNQPATKKFEKPVYVVQGKQDTAVPYQVTQAMVENSNKLGSTPAVIFDLVDGATHTQAIVKRNTEVVDFIKKNMPAQ